MPRLASRLPLCSPEIGFGIVCASAKHIGITLTVVAPPKQAVREASAREDYCRPVSN